MNQNIKSLYSIHIYIYIYSICLPVPLGNLYELSHLTLFRSGKGCMVAMMKIVAEPHFVHLDSTLMAHAHVILS